MTEQELEQKLEQELIADLEAKALELLPCPFCGARPYVNHIAPHAHSEALQRLIPSLPDHPGSYTIECTACPASFIAESWEMVKKTVEHQERKSLATYRDCTKRRNASITTTK